MGKIFYLCPDEAKPSWGIGMIYAHVEMLVEQGFPACVLHSQKDFTLPWLRRRVPLETREQLQNAGPKDTLVVPEVMVCHPEVRVFAGRRVVFIQGGFLIHKGLGGNTDYQQLGFEKAIVILPHMKNIVVRYYGIDAEIVSPFIADYFFSPPYSRPRKRRILMIPKAGYAEAGILDYPLLEDLLRRMLPENWELEELKSLEHESVASKMQDSTFLISVNSHEGFNSTVPEAMAAGCIPICYRGFGGRDFLEPEKNALVFENNDVYSLLDRVLKITSGEEQLDLAKLRTGARETALRFTESNTRDELLRFWSRW